MKKLKTRLVTYGEYSKELDKVIKERYPIEDTFVKMLDTAATMKIIDPQFIKTAKEIVGEWGYEEEYWWGPIAVALREAYNKGLWDKQLRRKKRKPPLTKEAT